MAEKKPFSVCKVLLRGLIIRTIKSKHFSERHIVFYFSWLEHIAGSCHARNASAWWTGQSTAFEDARQRQVSCFSLQHKVVLSSILLLLPSPYHHHCLIFWETFSNLQVPDFGLYYQFRIINSKWKVLWNLNKNFVCVL